MTVPRFLMLAGLLAVLAGWLVFMPHRPVVTGPQAIGRLEVVLRDSAGRALPVTVWYPEGTRTPAPVILYSPGWGGRRDQSSIQVENLARHGFVVVGCDDVASDSIDVSSDAALKATIERAGRHVVVQAKRVIDVLRALESGQAPALAGRLDLGRVGAMGYSVGGAVAIQAGLMEPRISAVLNIDGALSGPTADQIGSQAYFLLSSREALPTEAESNSPGPVVRNYAYLSTIDIPRNKRRMEQPHNYWAMIEPADHDDLSDDLFTLHRSKLFRSNFQRAAMNEAIGRLEVAFFRSTLMGDDTALRDLLGKNNQTVRWISSTSPTPGTAKAQQ